MSTQTALAPFETKASNTRDRTFEGLASTFGNVDFGGDTVMPGAYTKTLQEWRTSGRSLPLVDSHDYSSVVRTRLGKLIDARETSGGLWTKWKVFKTRAGDDLLAMLEDEGIDGLSIGYTVADSEVITLNGKSVRALKAINLREVSAVHWGMDPHALIDIQSVKQTLYDASWSSIPKNWSSPSGVAPNDPRRIKLEADILKLESAQRDAQIRELEMWVLENT